MKNTLLISALAVLTLWSCDNKNQNKIASQEAENIKSDKREYPSETISDTGYNISKIPITDKFHGVFPYFQLPEGYAFTDPNSYQGDGQTKDFDKEYFYDHGSYTSMEGKTFKAEIRISEEFKHKKFSPLEIQKSFDELIKNLGGVKINTGEPLRDGEEERIKKEDPEAYNLGYMHSCNNWKNVNTYIIRTAEKTVFVQYNLGKDQTSITVLETKPFENKMSIVQEKPEKDSLDKKKK
ncbi:hypothetical protein [Chryseobacterium turcicum]|uniref:Uncharacterized protein n=1 Tax=Chryseobacterium turcicum TaxID=2898076 RepID=A0A9Q3YV46_9FLAO|nr:hypothetical protein [Chryseobacterium turcicum]MCD1116609.1 hypothetical protein [Chryseobacterium turcicum]